MKDTPNIFETLSHFTVSHENYLTEAFVFLLKFLLVREPDFGLSILNQLCGQSGMFQSEDIAELEIFTQLKDKSDQPDIWIRTPGRDKLVYVEVKHDAPLGPQQLERYLDSLKNAGYNNSKLVLLARSRTTATDTTLQSGDFHLVCWYHIYNWLGNSDSHEAICDHFVHEFQSFLEAKNMSMRHVDQACYDGTLAMNDLMEMLKAALAEVFPKVKAKLSYSWVHRGFSAGSSAAGIRFASPNLLFFEQANFKTHFDLVSEGFFELDKDAQYERLVGFLQQANADSLKTAA